MKPAHLFLPCLLLLASAAQAQFRTHYEIALMKAQPLVILLEEEDPKQLKKLADKPADLTQYKAYVAYYNTQMRELAPRFWHVSPSVEFKPKSELATLRKLKNTQTVVLEHFEERLGSFGRGTASDRANTMTSNPLLMGTATVAAMDLVVVGSGDKKYQFRSPLPPGALFASDIIFAFRSLERRLHDEETGQSDITETKKGREARLASQSQALRAKTLLLDQDAVDATLTEERIKELYPYPFQLVPHEMIERAVLEADTRYAYARWLTYSVENIGHTLISTDDSHTFGIISDARGGPGRNPNAVHPIGKGNLKAFAEFASNGLPRTK